MDIRHIIERAYYLIGDYPTISADKHILTLRDLLINRKDQEKDRLVCANIDRIIEDVDGFLKNPHTSGPHYPNISIELLHNKTEAYVTLIPGPTPGTTPSLNEVYKAIERAAIQPKLVDRDIVQRAHKRFMEARDIVWRVLVARGKKPVKGKNSEMDFATLCIDKNITEKTYLIESIEDLNYTSRVKKNSLICEFKPPSAGEQGMTVTGAAIAAIPGETLRYNCGNNVYMNPDGKRYTAETEGQIVIEGNTVSVIPLKLINGDLSYQQNFSFDGNVVITGNIRNCQRMDISHDLVVYGDIIETNVNVQGDLIVGQDIVGKNKSYLKAGKRVFARLLCDSIIESQENIIVKDAISYCDITCGGKVMAVINKGEIVGGSIKAHQTVEARTIGSEIGTLTEVKAGKDFLRDKLATSLEGEIERHKENLKHIQNIKTRLSGKNFSFRRLDSNMQDMYLEIIKSETESQKDIKNITSQITELKKLPKELLHSSIGVIENLHPGVMVEVSGVSKYIDTLMHAVLFTCDPAAGSLIAKSIGAPEYDFC